MRKVFLLAAIVVFLFSGLNVFAENDSVVVQPSEDERSYPVGTEFTQDCITETEPIHSMASTYAAFDEAKFYSYLEEECMKHTTEIDVSSYNISASDIGEIYFKFATTHPELLIKTKLTYTKSKILGKTLKIMPEYLFESVCKEEAAREMMNEKVDEYIKAGEDCTDLIEKLLFIHDEIIKNCKYDLTYGENAYHAYGILHDNTAVCQGYSQAFYMICKKLGVETDFCISESKNHMWNYINIDGNWYHIDLTWDDPVVKNSSGEVVERTTAYHDNFLLCDKSMQESHGDKSGWETYLSALPQCTSEKFESQYIFNAPTHFSILNLSGKIGFYTKINGQNVLFSSKGIKCNELLTSEPVYGQSADTLYFYCLKNIYRNVFLYAGVFKSDRLDKIKAYDKGNLQNGLLYKHSLNKSESGTTTRVFFWDPQSMMSYADKIIIEN